MRKELQGSSPVLTGAWPSNLKMFFTGALSWAIQRRGMRCHWQCWNLSKVTFFMKPKAKIWKSLSFQVLIWYPSSGFCSTQKRFLKILSLTGALPHLIGEMFWSSFTRTLIMESSCIVGALVGVIAKITVQKISVSSFLLATKHCRTWLCWSSHQNQRLGFLRFNHWPCG